MLLKEKEREREREGLGEGRWHKVCMVQSFFQYIVRIILVNEGDLLLASPQALETIEILSENQLGQEHQLCKAADSYRAPQAADSPATHGRLHGLCQGCSAQRQQALQGY